MHRRIPLKHIWTDKKAIILFIIVLLISGIAHGYNMFNFPYYENDEGAYMSYAWSLVTNGDMAPYTYWYDHAPAGWVLIAIWTLLTGGFYTFGFSLNSGRVLMLVLQILSTLLLMLITRKVTRNNYAAVIVGLIFSISPIGLYFHRRILLDNIMTFWVLLSYYFVIRDKLKMNDVLLSAVCFGIAVLTKENAIFFIPGFLITIYVIAHRYNRFLALIKWSVVSGSIISLYFLFALLKGEFFSPNSILGGSGSHVSLLDTLAYQASREGGPNNGLIRNIDLWMKQDSFLLLAGVVSNVLLFVLSVFKSKRQYLGLVLLGIFFWLFLGRGGIIFEFYIVPLAPFLSLYIGVVIFEIFNLVPRYNHPKIINMLLVIVCALILGFYVRYAQISRSFGQGNAGHSFSKSKQTAGQLNAIQWIKDKINHDAVLIIDNYSYIDFCDPNNPSKIIFPNAHWYSKVDQDPDVKIVVMNNNPESIDFIVKTPQMNIDLTTGISPLTTDALNNSIFVKGFYSEGWGAEIWATRYPSKILQRTWSSYKSTFMNRDQQTVDPSNKLTTSEGQSYALLRSVWINDRIVFDKTWEWTKSHLLNDDGTIAWKWGKNSTGREEILDRASASDADTDIALALLFAHKQWNEEKYLNDARTILNVIWRTEVKSFNGNNYIVPGNWAKEKEVLIINPSYLSPYAYRIFSKVDKEHDWLSLVNTSYESLEGCMTSQLDSEKKSVSLPPNWCQMNSRGKFSKSEEDGLDSTEYSHDAVRTMWRLGLDYKWNNEQRAKKLLTLSSEFLKNEWDSNDRIFVGYTHDGVPWEKYESTLGHATALANFIATDQSIADEMYKSKVLEKLYEDFETNQHFWDDPTNYYTQNWAWFGTALYSDLLPNLWSTK